LTVEDENKPEIEYKLGLNEMTDILNGDIKTKGLKGCMVCVSTHLKTGTMAYVIFKDKQPIYESQQAEAIAIFLDLMKFDGECDKNGKKSSHRSNSSRSSRLRNCRN